MNLSTAHILIGLSVLNAPALMGAPESIPATVLVPSSNISAEIAAARGVVERMTPSAKDAVSFSINPSSADVEKIIIEGTGKGIKITASNTRKLIAGYGWYLKNVAKVHFSWNGDRLQLPAELPQPEKTITITEPWKIVFAYNYCTLSYTAAFWSWDRWQHEIDFLALSGFNYALVTAGLEKTWEDFLINLGYPKDKAIKFIPNPAAAAWWNMGNLEGHGGPLSQKQINQEATLGRQIVARMNQLGITPVLQGYVGFIPSDFSETVKIDGLQSVDQGEWCGFTRPAVVDPTCPAFPKLAEAWYKALHQVYGTKAHAYGGDLFHEGGRSGDINVTDAARSVQTAMQKASPGSKWVLQSWHGNPTKELLMGVEKDKAFVLQLTKNMANGGRNLRTYEGIPWVWCELANFGGNTGMYGGVPLLSRLGGELKEYENQGLVGMGTLSEGLEINPLHYALFTDRLWTKNDISLDKWLVDYARQRYGKAPNSVIEALHKLSDSIYNPASDMEGCLESIVCARPGWDVRKASTWSSPERYYKFAPIVDAARGYLKAAMADPTLLSHEPFRYDFVDIMRQVLADAVFHQLQVVREAYDSKNIAEYKKQVRIFLSMVTDLDDILATDQQFLLGTWQAKALSKGNTPEEKRLMDRAAKMLISTWIDQAPHGLNDYSNRQWAGFVKDFYLPRWKNFFNSQLEILEGKKDSGTAQTDFMKKTTEEELAFKDNGVVYPTQVSGNPLPVAQRIMKTHGATFDKLSSLEKDSAGLPWDLAQGKTLTFNVTDKISGPGTFSATFQYKGGSSALKIHSVKLYEGDREVAEETHEGWTGVENTDNVYHLNLKKYRTNLDAYTLKAEVSGASGDDSRGVMIFKEIK